MKRTRGMRQQYSHDVVTLAPPHVLKVGHRMVAAQVIAGPFCLRDHIVTLPIQIFGLLDFPRVRRHVAGRPSVSRIFPPPHSMKEKDILPEGFSVELIIDVEILSQNLSQPFALACVWVAQKYTWM